MASDVVIAYVTCADLDEARRIGRILVEERLAACVNLGPHEAIYRWEGRIEAAAEVGLFAKTTRATYPALEQRVRELHSYALPCVVTWPLEAGLPAYFDWVRNSVG